MFLHIARALTDENTEDFLLLMLRAALPPSLPSLITTPSALTEAGRLRAGCETSFIFLRVTTSSCFRFKTTSFLFCSISRDLIMLSFLRLSFFSCAIAFSVRASWRVESVPHTHQFYPHYRTHSPKLQTQPSCSLHPTPPSAATPQSPPPAYSGWPHPSSYASASHVASSCPPGPSSRP